jgi:hypothetical protein
LVSTWQLLLQPSSSRGLQVLPSAQAKVGTHWVPSSQRMPSSHISGFSVLSLLTIWLPHTVQAPVGGHTAPGSIWHVSEQPSRVVRLPSSHCSPVSRNGVRAAGALAARRRAHAARLDLTEAVAAVAVERVAVVALLEEAAVTRSRCPPRRCRSAR